MSPKLERRLGYRVPRSVLLPPYLRLSPYFEELSDSVDEVFSDMVDNKIRVLQNIRNMWVTNPELEQKVLEGSALQFEDWSIPEREILVQQVNMLGMKLKTAGVLTDNAYQRIARFLGMYWFEKGTYAFVEFINYCVGSELEVYRLWSRNNIPGQYSDLTRAKADGTPPGKPIWEGGEWFPTTHVELESKGNMMNLDVQTLSEFFYEIANYNLVLQSITTSLDVPIVSEGDDTAKIVAMGVYVSASIAISNQGSFGVAGPGKIEMTGMTNKFLTGDASFIMAEPSGWYVTSEGKKVPIYLSEEREITDSDILPLTVVSETGTSVPTTQTLLRGNAGWVPVPGAARSHGRIPYWSQTPTETTSSTVPTKTSGIRTALMSNPVGWIEFEPGKFSPHW